MNEIILSLTSNEIKLLCDSLNLVCTMKEECPKVLANLGFRNESYVYVLNERLKRLIENI